ncbi:MAG: phosphate uptake regulator PhoU [Candidatus Woesearchaeota archaeon]
MKRKVIQLAGKTFVVSLPSKWVKKQGIKKGDELEVDDSGKSLSIATQGRGRSTASIHLNGPEELMRRRINTAYKRGFDELELTYDDPKAIKAIQKELDLLLGYEIVKHGEKHCIIKCIANTLEEEYEVILRRIFLMLLEMGDESIKAIKNKEFERLNEIAMLENTNDKLTNFCKRVLNKNSSQNSIMHYCIVRELEHIADSYAKICASVQESKMNVSKETVVLYEKTNILLREFYDLFYDFKEDKAEIFAKHREEIKKQGKILIKAKQKEEALLITAITGIASQINAAAGPFYATKL